jgi:hypothetical protein
MKSFFDWVESYYRNDWEREDAVRSATYYVAWTPTQEVRPMVIVSVLGEDELGELLRSSAVGTRGIQFHFEEPMDYRAMRRFLDELADYEYKRLSRVGESFKFLYGKGVDSGWINTR